MWGTLAPPKIKVKLLKSSINSVSIRPALKFIVVLNRARSSPTQAPTTPFQV